MNPNLGLQASALTCGLPVPAQSKQPLPRRVYVPWRERIRHFSWQWEALVTATAVTSSLVHLFPYNNEAQALKIVALIMFFIALVIFVFNFVCIAIKAVLFPKACLQLITDPNQSSFMGFVAVGGAGLLDAALNINRDWNTGHHGFLYTMWGLWWLNAGLAYTIALIVIFFILGQKSRDLAKVLPIWIIPVVALIATSTCGGLYASSLMQHSHTLALVTTTFSLTMCVVGLAFTTMISASFLLRLFLYGAPEATAVFATFNTLTPLGQGGYSLLVNGENFSKLIPTHLGISFPQSQIAGQIIYAVCFCFAYLLWCMGLAWIAMSVLSIARRANKLPRFCVAYWSLLFPNGVFALLSVQLGNVLQSRFYHGFGAAWSIIVFIMWIALFLRSIPAFIDGTMFLPPASPHGTSHRKHWKKKHGDEESEKHTRSPTHSHDHFDSATLVDEDHSAV